MRVCRFLVLSIVLMLLAAGGTPAEAAGRVRLELVGEGPGAALIFQEWARVLGRAGVKNVRIRTRRPTDKVGIEVRGTENSPLYVVTGVLRSRDELLLPSGRFRRRDAARLAHWLDDLARHGPAADREQPSAFGLSSKQFEQVRADLSQPVGFSTAGMARGELAERTGRHLTLPLQIDPALAHTLNEDKLREELSGLSCGTVLAYVLRPMGYCLVPRVTDRGPVYAVTKAKPALEVWPIGWEPEKPRREVLPALFEFHNVNIRGVSAATALRAIGKRLKVPVLLDHNALARHGIDPNKAVVSHPRSRTTYSIALRKLLFQAGLKSELRVDEAGRPFLWISTIKPM